MYCITVCKFRLSALSAGLGIEVFRDSGIQVPRDGPSLDRVHLGKSCVSLSVPGRLLRQRPAGIRLLFKYLENLPRTLMTCPATTPDLQNAGIRTRDLTRNWNRELNFARWIGAPPIRRVRRRVLAKVGTARL